LPELFGANHRYIGVSMAREVSAVISAGIAPVIGSVIIAWVISANGGGKRRRYRGMDSARRLRGATDFRHYNYDLFYPRTQRPRS
jgi:hypothetical protein